MDALPQLRFEASTTRALEGAELVLLLTEWDEYRALSPAAVGSIVRRRMVLDARNVLDAGVWRAQGWTVRGLGTGFHAEPEETVADAKAVVLPVQPVNTRPFIVGSPTKASTTRR